MISEVTDQNDIAIFSQLNEYKSDMLFQVDDFDVTKGKHDHSLMQVFQVVNECQRRTESLKVNYYWKV